MTERLSDGLYRTIDAEAGIVLYHGKSTSPAVWGIPIEETELTEADQQ